MGVGLLLLFVRIEDADSPAFGWAPFIRITYGVLAIQVGVGLLGFLLHVTADLGQRALPFVQRFVFGAPAFAPLLFGDLAGLAALGLWALSRSSKGLREGVHLEASEAGAGGMSPPDRPSPLAGEGARDGLPGDD